MFIIHCSTKYRDVAIVNKRFIGELHATYGKAIHEAIKCLYGKPGVAKGDVEQFRCSIYASVETYLLHLLHATIFPRVLITCQSEDAKLNKKIRYSHFESIHRQS